MSDLNTLLPAWMKEGNLKLYPSIDCVHCDNETLRLVFTRLGLERFKNKLKTVESLHDYINNAISGDYVNDTETFKVHPQDTDLLVRQSSDPDSAISTFLTLAALGKVLPDHTTDYIFQPVDLYFAASLGSTHILVMENVNALDTQYAGRNAINALRTILNETRKASLPVQATLQDMLMRRYEGSKPVIALVDVQSPGLTSFLEGSTAN